LRRGPGLASLAFVLVSLLAACAAGPGGEPGLPATRVADGVYAFLGSSGEAGPANGGEVGNGGFIVGETGTVMINTGSSYRHGQRMIAAAERIGGRPVVLAVITQPLQEFVMGSAAFEEHGIPLMAQAASAALIGQRCERCLHNLTQLLGSVAMQGTRVVVPERRLSGSTSTSPGGRSLRLLDFGWAQTPGDLAVLDERSHVLFAGGLVSIGRLPDVRDADAPRWIAALGELRTLPFERLVPGYGPVGTKASAVEVAGYLEALDRSVRMLLRGGASLSEAVPAGGLPDYAGWSLYGVLQPRNVQQTYLRLEAEEFDR